MVTALLFGGGLAAQDRAAQQGAALEGAAKRGWEAILNTPFVPPYFDEETFREVWRVWPEPLRSRAERADDDERRRMAFDRYGLTPRPGAADARVPLQFVVSDDGAWTPNCFACHSGELLGRPYPGLPNTRYALKTLIEETRAVKTNLGKPWSPVDWGLMLMELGTTNGRTNAVIFGVALGDRRDDRLNVVPPRRWPNFIHHDMDAPPLWHFSKKHRLYLDGFAEKDHRPLMQFTLDPSNSGERVRAWEPQFRDIAAYLETLQPPRYPFPIDESLAATGRGVFRRHCARCHGGAGVLYPEKTIPLATIGTDRLRFDALGDGRRADYGRNWLSYFGKAKTVTEPTGYVAPPLDGIWASAPYFHNGSVPTLWHVLHPGERPRVWRPFIGEFDRERVGWRFEAVGDVPALRDRWERRWYFDTSAAGHSAAGHDFPDRLTEADKRAVLEFLKTL